MLEVDKIYKHSRNTDVAYGIKHCYLIVEKDLYKVRAVIYNIVNPKNIFKIKDTYIDIKRSDMKNWLPYEPTKETS